MDDDIKDKNKNIDKEKTSKETEETEKQEAKSADGNADSNAVSKGSGVSDGEDELTVDEHSDYKPADRFDASAVHHLSGMYKNCIPRLCELRYPGACCPTYRRRTETGAAAHTPFHEADGRRTIQ